MQAMLHNPLCWSEATLRNSALVLALSIGAFRLTRSPQGTRPALWEDGGPRTAFPVVSLNCGQSTQHQAWGCCQAGGLLLRFLPCRLPHHGHPWQSGQAGPVSLAHTEPHVTEPSEHVWSRPLLFPLFILPCTRLLSHTHTGQIPGPGDVPLSVPDSRKTTQTLTLVVIWQAGSVELAVLEQSRGVHSRSLVPGLGLGDS